MNCKKCGTEIPEGVTACPQCGETFGEKNGKLLKIIMGSVGGLVIVAVLVSAILYGMGINFLPRENDIFYKDSYTVKDSVLEERLNTVVATMGDLELTSGELQLYYWQNVFGFLQEYSTVLSSIGLDLTQPFDKQICDEETGMTFQQYFLQLAIESWSKNAALVLLSREANFQLGEEEQKTVDSMKEAIEATAKEAGYTDMEKFVDEKLVPGSSFQSYYDFNVLSYMALAYYDVLYNGMLPTAEEIEAYYQANEATLIEKGMGKDAGLYYDVRHILIPVEGKKDENGNVTYTEEDWEKCRVKAQNILDKFLNGEYEGGTTENVFAKLAQDNSADPGSKNNGGLYTKLTKSTNFIEGFKNWYLEEGRKAGDTGLVKNTQSSTQGYHIMYFSGTHDIWEVECEELLIQTIPDKTTKLLQDATDRWPVEIDFTKMILGNMSLV